MPIIIKNMATCRICQQVIQEEEKKVSLPILTVNNKDPLQFLNDSLVHETCFKQFPLYEAAVKRLDILIFNSDKICSISGQLIANPDDYFRLPYLTESPESPLYRYNCKQFSKLSLQRFQALHKLINLLEQLQQSEEWEGDALVYYIKVLEKIHESSQ